MFTNSLCTIVQRNCNIADAKYAANYTLCTYLMKMREFCRWDKGYSYNELMPKEEVGEWVSQRESLWDQLEEESYAPIKIDGHAFDPFETEAINSALLPKGMVYSGGIGARCAPHFFLGKLLSSEVHDNHQVIVSSEECARDLGAPPAMTLGNTIFIRRESIRRMLWEKMQEWRWHKIENPMSKAFSFYDFDNDTEAALDEMAEVELNSIILHEKGEINTTHVLGPAWKEYLATLNNARLELMLRSAKDLFADASITLPALIAENNLASIHFFAGNMSSLRKQLSPSFQASYQTWRSTEDIRSLSEWADNSARHWQEVLMLILASQNKTDKEIEKLLEESTL
ncbi:MAG: Sfum_1244 family protein [Pseudomonadota bacterium]